MFTRLLVANRGEIAVRIIRACREMGIASIAVYSDADREAWHTTLADEAVSIGAAPPAESYLSVDRIIDAARRTSADAVHPGYGFLSEHQGLAAACAEAGLAFVGPPAEVLARMGSKIAARAVAEAAGVPVVPGVAPSDQSDAAVAAAARQVGFPVLIKPAGGGGGIGMKAVRDDATLASAILQARREAVAAFGDGTLYVERLIDRPRHVEFQILADHHGRVVHLLERECSLQRRHQKVIEESPSTALSSALRARMGEAAVAVARAAGYRNAGTVEFLLDGSGAEPRFYFLEVNARLQVEHAVTEAVTGCDLVRAQIAIAAGQPLPWPQTAITGRGHAIEARVYAEDPERDDLPQAGRILLYRPPAHPGVRIDAGIVEGSEVSVHYDPLLAKLIAWGDTREAARRRAVMALREYAILGVRTNVDLLVDLLEHPRFVAGDVHTDTIEAEARTLDARRAAAVPSEVLALADLVRAARPGPIAHGGAADPWTTLRGFRV